MRRPRLVAFHLAMAGVYATILLAWQAGYPRLSFLVWAAALTVCAAGLLLCGAMLVISGWPGSAPLPARPRRRAGDARPPGPDLRSGEFDVEALLSGIAPSIGVPDWPEANDQANLPIVPGGPDGDSTSAGGGPGCPAAISRAGDREAPKYELTEETLTLACGTTLRRIRALQDFGGGPGAVRKGDLGGFVESGHNLSHRETAWVYDNGRVFGKARVAEDAQVAGEAEVSGQAELFGNAQVFGRARVRGGTRVFDNAQIGGDAEVDGALVRQNACVLGNAVLRGQVLVGGDSQLHGTAKPERGPQVDGSWPGVLFPAQRTSSRESQAPADGRAVRRSRNGKPWFRRLGIR